MNKTPFKIGAVVLLISLIILSVHFSGNQDEDSPRRVTFAYMSDEVIWAQPHLSDNLTNDEPVYHNYRYDIDDVIEEKDIQGYISLFDDSIPILSFIKDERNGEMNYIYLEGEMENKKFMKLTESGQIYFDDKKLVGYTAITSEEALLEISNQSIDLISSEEDFALHQLSLQKISKYSEDFIPNEIGSFYWVSFDQIIDGLKVRKTHISVDIKNGEVVGYNDFRYYSNRMTRIEIIPNLFSSVEASKFALSHVANQYNFNEESLSISDWDVLYGFDPDSELITPIYSFHVDKDHRSYFTMVFADKNYNGNNFNG